MKILVTGISGFVGRHLTARLLEDGHEVAGLDLVGWSDAPPGVHCMEADLLDGPALREVIGAAAPDAVAHLAALSAPRLAAADPSSAFRANVTGTVELLDAVSVSSPAARFFFAGSSEVYGPGRQEPFAEGDFPAPVNPYGASKAAAEIAVLQYGRARQLDVVLTRSFPHSGPGQSPDFALPAFARQIARIEAGLQPPVLKVGNLEARRDYLHVADVADAYTALLAGGESGAVYNVCSGTTHSVREGLEGLLALAGCEVAVEEDSSLLRAVDAPLVRGNPQRLINEFGWSPRRGFDDMLEDILADWRLRIAEEVRA